MTLNCKYEGITPSKGRFGGLNQPGFFTPPLLKTKKESGAYPYRNSSGRTRSAEASSRFLFQLNSRYPLFFLLPEERGAYHKETGCDDYIIGAVHKVKYYKGATHISFVDHGYINPEVKLKLPEPYFDETLEERKAFCDKVRKDIRAVICHHISE